MKRILLILVSCLFLTGCLQAKTTININEDGSGTVESSSVIPQGTVQLLEMMFGAMMQAMAGMSEEGGASGAAMLEAGSVVDQVFSREQLEEKVAGAGGGIKILRYENKKTETGVSENYEVAFSSIIDLSYLEVTSSLNIYESGNNGIVIETKGDESAAAESQASLDQFASFKDSEEYNNLDPMTKSLIMNAMEGFKIDFVINTPYPVGETLGMFKKISENSAGMSIEGNILEDTELLQTFHGMVGETSRVVFGNADVESVAASSKIKKPTFSVSVPINKKEELMDQNKSNTQEGGSVTITLNNGKIISGIVVEKDDDVVTIIANGVNVTYYMDEIKSIE